MLVENATLPWGQSWERVFQDCPHGEDEFSTRMCIYHVNRQLSVIEGKKSKKAKKQIKGIISP